MCRAYMLACLSWCCQLLTCFSGELCLVHWWKMFIASALSNMGAWNLASRDTKAQPSCKHRVLVAVLLEDVKVRLSREVCESNRFGCFCGCNVKTSPICHQWSGWSPPSKQGSYLASMWAPVAICKFVLTLRHIMTSALHHNYQRIFNQPP